MKDVHKCPKCGTELPVFNKDGQHNFCPTSEIVAGKIVEVCMECKMKEVVSKWEKA